MVFPSLSGIQVNYFLFLWVGSSSPFPGPSTFPSTHTGLAIDRQLCSKPIFVYLPALENPPTRPWNWPEGSNLRAKVCHYCRARSYFYFSSLLFSIILCNLLTFCSFSPCVLRYCVSQSAHCCFLCACLESLASVMPSLLSGFPRWAWHSQQTWSVVHVTLFLLLPHPFPSRPESALLLMVFNSSGCQTELSCTPEKLHARSHPTPMVFASLSPLHSQKSSQTNLLRSSGLNFSKFFIQSWLQFCLKSLIQSCLLYSSASPPSPTPVLLSSWLLPCKQPELFTISHLVDRSWLSISGPLTRTLHEPCVLVWHMYTFNVGTRGIKTK